MEKEIAEENAILKALKLHKIEHYIAVGIVILSIFCICFICIIKKKMKKNQYDEDEDESIGQNYFYNKKNMAPSPYDQNGFDSTYSQSYKNDDTFDGDNVQIKDKGNINMRVVSLHDDRHGINQSHYNSLGSESPYLK